MSLSPLLFLHFFPSLVCCSGNITPLTLSKCPLNFKWVHTLDPATGWVQQRIINGALPALEYVQEEVDVQAPIHPPP